MFVVSRTVPHYFVQVFTSSPEHIELSVWGIKVFTLAIIPLSFEYVLVDGLTAMGRTKTALCISMFRKCFYCFNVVFFAFTFGAKNAFFAQPVSDFTASVIAITVFLIVFNKHLKLREQRCASEGIGIAAK